MDKNHLSAHKVILFSDEPSDVAYRTDKNSATGEKYHFHDGLEIMQMWSDEGMVFVEDKMYPMQKGYIYIFNAQDMHCTRPSSTSNYIRSKLTFSPVLMSGILKELDDLYLLDSFFKNRAKHSNCIAPDEASMQCFDVLFRNIVQECTEKHEGYTAIIRAYLLEMLVMIHRQLFQKEKTTFKNVFPVHNHVRNILNYINQHLTDNLIYPDLCSEIHLSRYHICHLFKDATGMTISQYIIYRRISEAKKLLLTEKPISEIAMETGFSSFSLFSRTFKKFTGDSPKSFRKMKTSSEEPIM